MAWRPIFAFFLGLIASTAFGLDGIIPPGTRVKLTVQRTLSTHPAGGALKLVGVKPITREDTFVLFEVMEDVRDEEGGIAIPAGSTATGRVIDSQVGGGFRPSSPRLAITIDSVEAWDGTIVPLRFEGKHEGKWARAFGRAETAAYLRSIRSDRAETVFAKPEYRDSTRELFDLIVTGRIGALFRDPSKLLKLKYIAEQSGLPILVSYIQDGRIRALAELISDIQSGNLRKLSLKDAKKLLDAFRLVGETWQAGSQLISWLGGRLSAPQIVVPAGFPVEAVVEPYR